MCKCCFSCLRKYLISSGNILFHEYYFPPHQHIQIYSYLQYHYMIPKSVTALISLFLLCELRIGKFLTCHMSGLLYCHKFNTCNFFLSLSCLRNKEFFGVNKVLFFSVSHQHLYFSSEYLLPHRRKQQQFFIFVIENM